jgi:hypothetical protein
VEAVLVLLVKEKTKTKDNNTKKGEKTVFTTIQSKNKKDGVTKKY